MLDIYRDEIKKFLKKETVYDPKKIFDGLGILSNFNSYASSLSDEDIGKLLAPISSKMNSLLKQFAPQNRITAEIRHFFNDIKKVKIYFNPAETEKIKNGLYGITKVYGNKKADSSISLIMPDAAKDGALYFDGTLAKQNMISIPYLLLANKARFADNKDKSADFSISRENYEKLKEFLDNLREYGDLNKAFINSRLISIGKSDDYTPTLPELWRARFPGDTGENTYYFRTGESAYGFQNRNIKKQYRINKIETDITERDWLLLKAKEKFLRKQAPPAPEFKKPGPKEFFIEISAPPPPSNKQKKDLAEELLRKNKDSLLLELAQNRPEEDRPGLAGLKTGDIARLIAEGRIENKDWIYPENDLVKTGKTKAFRDLFAAVQANNSLKSLFARTKIIDAQDNPVDPITISKANSYNQIITDIKQSIGNSLLRGDSVILKAREGVDYAVNTSGKKPFENVQQLYLQQVRSDNGFDNPYFMPSYDVRNNGLSIIPKNMATILSYVNKNHFQIEFTCFYNANQLKSGRNTLDIARTLSVTRLNPAFVKQEEIPPVKTYEPKSVSVTENFTKHMSEYFESIYTGKPYTPPHYTKEELKTLFGYVTRDNSPFFNDTRKAHLAVKESLLSETRPRRRDHARIR